MADRVIINIEWPEVGIGYEAESKEAELGDRLAASELALHALAQHVRDLRATLHLPRPSEVSHVISADSWRRKI